MQDPEIFLNELGTELNCCVDNSRPAVIDAAYRVSLGYETYFFADSTNLNAFLEKPYRYCGRLTDPITKKRFAPTVDSPTAEYHGHTYVFASASTHSMFESMPDMYYLPNYTMLPKDSTEAAH